MAKHTKKRKMLPDKVNTARQPVSRDAKNNPFELKLNRQKHQVINRKFKSERGLPGVARDRAISKRKATLLKEYEQRNKDSILLDRRIGEGDASLDPDEKIARRMSRESSRKNRRNIFNLNDDEVLTHLGQSIEDAKAQDDPRSDDEDIYDKLDAAFVDQAHFGGFLKKAHGTEESRKRAIDDLIADSKRLKHERQMEVDENFKLTEELDSKWRNVSSLVMHPRPDVPAAPVAASDIRRTRKTSDGPDSFDLLVSELQTAPRIGAATDRSKSAEELAKEERERLEELERARLARAQGDYQDDKSAPGGGSTGKGFAGTSKKHRSADDIDDGFAIQDDGEANGDGGGETDSGDDDSGSGSENDPAAEHSGDNGDSANGTEDESEVDDSDVDEDAAEDDSYDDLKSESEDECGPKDTAEKTKATARASTSKKTITGSSEPPQLTTAAKDIPYLIAVPENMDAYEELIQGRTTAEELIIVERIINGNAPSLHEKNRRRLEIFLRLLIDRIFLVLDEAPSGDGAQLSPAVLQLVDGLVVHIHRLTEMSPNAAARTFVEIVRNIYHGGRTTGPKKDSNFPGLELLIMFKLISICFSASDHRHAVATPALLCMAHLLTTCRVTDGRNMLRGIFLAQTMLEYVNFAGKFCPEVVAFITRLLNESQRLTLSGTVRESDLRIRLSDLYRSPDIELPRTVRCKIVFGLLSLVDLAADTFSKLPSFPEIFHGIRQRLGKLETSCYPELLKNLLTTVLEKLSRTHPRGPLCRERRRPQMLKLYEPLVEERVDMLRKVHKDGRSARAETKKLQAKYKKELKSAMREIRRDNQFLAQHKLKEQLRLDSERKMKVKRLFGELANQQGELNALQKLKDKKK